jgi:hypothetical protein
MDDSVLQQVREQNSRLQELLETVALLLSRCREVLGVTQAEMNANAPTEK